MNKMMKNKFIFLFIILFLFCTMQKNAFGQDILSPEQVIYEIYNFYSPKKIKVDFDILGAGDGKNIENYFYLKKYENSWLVDNIINISKTDLRAYPY